ncbi:IclR family transcriptional regulator [Robbsia andropogonis]|uniref:IclR family transcriptional regulator n=1 Tax=Robbsia andropogonis TaxID=28092 RepID=UPI000463D052|nr:IclR family transcriptional regulator [Robbsia andropogonis]MCP1118530.1 IclR family transcriptional regulator [Robbsia andropogonis]MCP1127997.1 IclR family transcriptional regulator [Robbsia andropogonis]
MNYIVESIDLALKLLSFVAEHPGLGVTELSAQLGLNKSRTYRMLCTLESHLFVVQDACSARYALGPQAFVLGVAAARQNTLVRLAQKHMHALHQAVEQSIVLRVRQNMESVCVARCEGDDVAYPIEAVGNRRSIHAGAAGKVLLAFAPEDVRATFLSRYKQQAPANGLMNVVQELDAVARNRYAITAGDVLQGAVSIAVPVWGADGEVAAALSIAGAGSQITSDKVADYLARLRAISAALSMELGYGGDGANDASPTIFPDRCLLASRPPDDVSAPAGDAAVSSMARRER